MSLLAVGLSHRSAPHALLERAALSTERTGKLLADLAASPNVHEAAALATCNRIEVYAGVEKFHAAVDRDHRTAARCTPAWSRPS